MKLHKKPDLLTILAIFVGLGVLFTSLTNFSEDHSTSPALISSAPVSESSGSTLFKGNFVQVTSGKQRIQIEN